MILIIYHIFFENKSPFYSIVTCPRYATWGTPGLLLSPSRLSYPLLVCVGHTDTYQKTAVGPGDDTM